MFDSASSDIASDIEPCMSCGGIGFGGCTCDEEYQNSLDEQ